MDSSYSYFDTPGPSNYTQLYYQPYDSSTAYCEQSWSSSSSSGHSVIETPHEYPAYEAQFHSDPLRPELSESRESFSSSSSSPPLTSSGRKPTKKQREQEMELEEKCLEMETKKLRRQQVRYEQYLACLQKRVNDLLCAQKM